MREIACFDLFLALICVMSFRKIENTQLSFAVATSVSLLSVLIAINNSIAFWQSGLSLHLQGATTHFVAATVGAYVARTLKLGAPLPG